LTLGTALGYNDYIITEGQLGVLKKKVMKKLYYEFWLPFTITKRRILILAIASYIALC
jgi:hypothetical protein